MMKNMEFESSTHKQQHKYKNFFLFLISGLVIISFLSFSHHTYANDSVETETNGFVSVISTDLSSRDSEALIVAQSNAFSLESGQIIVRFKNLNHAIEASSKKTSDGFVDVSSLPKLSKIFKQYDIKDAEQLFVKSKAFSLYAIVKLTSSSVKKKEDINALIAALKAEPEILYAEPNFVMEAQFIPNDFYYLSSGAWGQSFRDLWGLVNINAENAWSISQGVGVIVGISDTGIDYNHLDITENIWENLGEIGFDLQNQDKRANGIDDDSNGYIDDWRGWNFVSNNNNPFDDNGHGTHVAGTVAAVGNNNLGIIGVAPQAKVMALKGLNNNGSGYLDDLIESVVYAADNGAKVINASWGGEGVSSQALIDAISYIHDIKDVAFVAAAGNSNKDVGSQDYGFAPANIRDVITVSAVNHDDIKASFSNFGYKIDVAAPGGGDTEPVGIFDQHRSILSLLSSGARSSMTGSGQLIIGTNYLRQAGTSMAAPHVSGVAALVRALNPSWNVEQVRQVIRRGSDDIGIAGFDSQFGYGRLNANEALNITSPLSVQITTPTSSSLIGIAQLDIRGNVNGSALANWRLEYSNDSTSTNWVHIASSTNAVFEGLLASWDVSTVFDGNYIVRLVAQNSLGEIFEDRINVTLDQIVINYPSSSQTFLVRSGQIVTVEGTVAPVNFLSYTLEIQNSSGEWLSNPAIILTNNGLEKVYTGTLGTWDTNNISADLYKIYLKVRLVDGSEVLENVKIIVDPTLHPGWPIQLGIIYSSGLKYAITDHLNSADINNDGDNEIIIAYGTTIRIYDHLGAIIPGWPQSVDPNNQNAMIQQSPVVGDVTGDGLPEIVGRNNHNQVFIWQSDGSLLSGWPKNISARSVSLADMNNDGSKEIIATDEDGIVIIFDENGVSLPGWPILLDGSKTYKGLSAAAVGDVNGDGKKEIAVKNNNGISNLYLLSFDGNILPGWPKAINPTAGDSYVFFSQPALGDLDDDGDLEVVVGSHNGSVYAFYHNGDTVVGWPKFTKATIVNSPVIGDIDGDGQVEIVAGTDKVIENNVYTNYLFAWDGNGDLLPGWPVKFNKPFTATFFGFGTPVLADIDGDGGVDILAASDFSEPYALNAYHSNGTKVLGFPKLTQSYGAWSNNTPAIADIDGDGLLELSWIDINANLYLWDLVASTSASLPWPEYRHDAVHTGLQPAIVVPVDTELPVASIVQPLDGSNVLGTIDFFASASDNIGVTHVEFYVDSTLLGTVFSSPYSLSWNTLMTTDGLHKLLVKAYDAAGNIGLSSEVSVIVNNIPPSISITNPANNSNVKRKSIVTITANASDINGLAKVEFYINNTLTCVDALSPYTCAWQVPNIAKKTYSLQARAYDIFGLSTLSSIVRVVSF